MRLIKFGYEELKEHIREAIEQNQHAERQCETQRAMDRAIEVAFEEDEIHLASAILLLMALRAINLQHLADQALMQLTVDNSDKALLALKNTTGGKDNED
jgi:hypothetical protein